MKAVGREETGFPKLLKEIDDCPERLCCLGNINLLKESKLIAMVGSRQMSDYGKRVVEMIVPSLVKNEVVIVSGMAFGVDAWVHKVCLENGGKTIAVLAGGVDVISPKSNKWLYDLILEKGGLIVSEGEAGKEPNKEGFLRRNRIISGLCQGVIVVEGRQRSGTLSTAASAARQGREVWAVPGRIDDPNSAAPNYLIRNGAEILLCNSVEKILMV